MCCLLTELPDIPAAKHPRRAAAFRSQAWSEWGWGGRGAGFPLGPGAGLPWAGQTQLRGGRQRATCCNVSPTLFSLESAKCSFLVGSPFSWRGGSVGGRDPLLSPHPLLSLPCREAEGDPVLMALISQRPGGCTAAF